MRRYRLGFISDADIYEHVRNTAKSYRSKITLADFNESIVDPIKLTSLYLLAFSSYEGFDKAMVRG